LAALLVVPAHVVACAYRKRRTRWSHWTCRRRSV